MVGRFPEWVGRGYRRTERMARTVVEARGGRRQTILHRSRPQRLYEVDLTACDAAERSELEGFLRSALASGRRFGFRDWQEFEAGARLEDGGSVTHLGPAAVGTGDGVRTAFQLGVTTSSGGVDVFLPCRPILAGLKVYLGGIEQPSGFSVDLSLGILTFSAPPAAGVAVGWSGLYDVLCELAEGEVETVLEGGVLTADRIRLEEVVSP